MLNKIILFLWKIRVCLLCFEMFEQGHSAWSGPAGDGTEFGMQRGAGSWGAGEMGDFRVQGGVGILGCRG